MQRYSPTPRALAGAAVSMLAIAVFGCTDAPTTPVRVAATPQPDQLAVPQNEPPAPAGLVTVAFGGGSLTLWPFTADDLGDKVADPINALFAGSNAAYVDPLRIRAALRRLDGNRAAYGFPPTPGLPFDCTWRDAVGDEQAAFAEPEQWTGSAIQLQCGEFGPIRFHVRLFGEGPWTLAGTHFELNIAGTATHRVLSWIVAREFLTVDLVRSGILAGAPGLSAPITPTPAFGRDPIEVPVYNALPVALRALIGGPLGNVTSPVTVVNDGRARLFVVGKAEPIVADVSEQTFTLEFNQTVPKPFCAGPTDFVKVTGPLYYLSTARVTPGGTYERVYSARGDLNVVAVNAVTGQLGPVQLAKISQEHQGSITPAGALARMSFSQRLFKADGAAGDVQSEVRHFGTRGHDEYRLTETCDR
jgi:hypothetical protein